MQNAFGGGKKIFAIVVAAAFFMLPFRPAWVGAEPAEKITICHATSSETNPFETIHVSANATNGHFENNGTTKAGHEGDFIINSPDANCPGPVATTGTLVVQKTMSGGTAASSDFMLHVMSNGTDVTGSPQAGTSVGTSYTLSPGTYTISETGGPSGFATSFSQSCSGGTISVTAGQTVICTVTNTFNQTPPTTGTLTVRKTVIGGTAASGDFMIHVMSNGSDVATSPQAGSSTGTTYTLAPGVYSVSETGGPSNFTQSFLGCTPNGEITVVANQNVICEVRNTFNQAATAQVHIFKFINGQQATGATASNAVFPFSVTFNASNIGSGTGTFTLDNSSTIPYQTSTVALATGASYSFSETTGGNVIAPGGTCEPGKTRLVGYRTGSSLSAALAATSTTTSPSFTNLTADQYAIVNNETCPAANVDVGVTKSVSNQSPANGSNVVYTVTVTNNDATNSAFNVNLNDVLPAGVSFASSVVSTGTYNSGTGLWTIGNLGASASATLSIIANVTAAASTVVTNTATISADNDSNSANNSATATLTVAGAGGGGISTDLGITKTKNVSAPVNGDTVVYTLTVTNNGNNATNVTVSDPLPSGLSFVSSTPSVGTFNSSNGVWTIGSLNNGATATLTMTTTVTAAAGATVTNTATVSGSQVDNNTANNQATVTFTVGAVAGASTGGGGGGGGPAPTGIPCCTTPNNNNNVPQVLGDFTDFPFIAPTDTTATPTEEQPAVLADTEDLPRTGPSYTALATIFVSLMFAAATTFLRRKEIN